MFTTFTAKRGLFYKVLIVIASVSALGITWAFAAEGYIRNWDMSAASKVYLFRG